MSKADKEATAPEIRAVEWLDLRTAAKALFTSMNEQVSQESRYRFTMGNWYNVVYS
jgi:hypothetical protein